MKKSLFKVISLAIAVAMVIACFAGCAQTAEKPAQESAAEATSTAAATEGADTSTDTKETPATAEASDVGGDWAEKAAAAVQISISEFQGPTEPAGAAPKDIKIAAIPSDGTLQGCVAPCEGVQKAAEALGWEFQMYDGKGSSSEQNKAILNAITWGADVIVCAAVDPKGVQQGIQAANEAGVLIVSGSNGIDNPNPPLELEEGQVNFAFDVAPDYGALGEATAAWIVNDAGDAGHVAVFGDQEFPSCMAFEAGLLKGFEGTNMKVSDVMYFTGSQVGDTLNRQVTSYLTQNPDCKYVFMPFDPAAASVVEGLNQANMTDVKVIGVLGIQQNVEYIRSGNIQVATAAYDNNYMGWAVVDQIIRLLNEKELSTPVGENLPYIVLDATNIPEEGSNWEALGTFDYEKEFLSLWA